MSDYTVILLRPRYLTSDYGKDTYVAHINAEGLEAAVSTARKELFKTDRKDKMDVDKAEDYEVCLIFPSHIEPVYWGWQDVY